MEITAVYKVEELDRPLTIELIERLTKSQTAEYVYSVHRDVDYLVDAEEELQNATQIIAFNIDDFRLLNKQLNYNNVHPIVLENLIENKIENQDFRTDDEVEIAEITFSKNPA